MSSRSVTQFYNEGLRQANKRNWRKAVESLKNATNQNGRHVNSYNALGMIYMRHGNNMAAKRYWKKALRIDSGNITARQCLSALNVQAPRTRIKRLVRPSAYAIILTALIVSNLVWIRHASELRSKYGLLNPMASEIQNIEIDRQSQLGQADPLGQTDLQSQNIEIDHQSQLGQADLLEQTDLQSQNVELANNTRSSITQSQVKELYDQALADCMSRKHSSAIEKFRKILEYPSFHNLKDNAQYWLAECYSAQGKYAQALSEFQKVKEYYPKANKVFDSELMVAYTYCRLGNIKQARQKCLQIAIDFPGKAFQTDINALSEKIQSAEAQKIMIENKESDIAGKSSDGPDDYAYYGIEYRTGD